MKTAAQMIKEIRDRFQSDIEYSKLRKRTLNHPNVREGFKQFAKILRQAEKVGDPLGNPFVYAEYTKLSGDISIYTPSLKSDEVCQFLEWLETNVGECKGSEDHVSEYSAQRSFHFDTEFLRIEVTLLLPLDGDACHRVKVDTKMVEQAVYKLECA